MALIDKIVSFDAARPSATTSFTAHAPWLDSAAAIECMAQAAACLAGMDDRRRDPAAPPRPGLLLGTRKMELRLDSFVAGRTYFAGAECAFADAGAASFSCAISESPGGAPVATALLNAYRPGDFDKF